MKHTHVLQGSSFFSRPIRRPPSCVGIGQFLNGQVTWPNEIKIYAILIIPIYVSPSDSDEDCILLTVEKKTPVVLDIINDVRLSDDDLEIIPPSPKSQERKDKAAAARRCLSLPRRIPGNLLCKQYANQYKIHMRKVTHLKFSEAKQLLNRLNHVH